MFKKIATLLLAVMLIAVLATSASALIRGRNIEDLTRSINIPIQEFSISGTSAYTPLSASTTPGLEMDNLIPSMVWSDGEAASKAVVTFQLPATFVGENVGDLTFNLLCDQSTASSTTSYVDFDIYINTNGAGNWDAAAVNNAATALTLTAGSTQKVTLTLGAVETAALNPGDWITLEIWRDDTTGTGTADLEVYGVTVNYKADQ
jgi:hypothetical protein